MKKVLNKFRNKVAMLFAAMLMSAFCIAEVPTLTPSVHDTWRGHISTAKCSVEHYAHTGNGVWFTIEYNRNVVRDSILDFASYAKEQAYVALQKFAYKTGAVAFADAPDLSAISTGFFEKGPEILRKRVNSWDLAKSGIKLYKKVKAPIKLPKLSAKGNPRPYRTNDDSSGNGFSFTDRTLTVNQSKWDFTYNPEEFRNTYLDDASEKPEYEQGLDQVAKEYVSAINTTMGSGTYNASGSTAAAIATGYLTIIAAEITATNITPVVTGAITSANAVTKAELLVSAMPAWMREEEQAVKMLCSYAVFDLYKTHYRTLNGFGFDKSSKGYYQLDGTNVQLVPVSWLGTSQRLILTVDGNLVAGTDSDGISVHPSMKMDQIETRIKLPVGFQIGDLDALIVNDQA